MTALFETPRFRLELVNDPDSIREAQKLRHLCFFTSRGLEARPDDLDSDSFDPLCLHGLLRDKSSGQLVSTFRLMHFGSGSGIGASYAARYYDLTRLKEFPAPLAELGRFCVHPGRTDPDISRCVWAGLTRFVAQNNIQFIFGCSSFSGTDPALFGKGFAVLERGYIGDGPWRVGSKHTEIERLDGIPQTGEGLPSLLNFYLALGGWVSDHLVIDRELNTMHVFTALEMSRIPKARADRLRVLAGLVTDATAN